MLKRLLVNADPAYTYKYLLNNQYNKKWSSKKINKLDFSMGLFVIYFGTKKNIKILLTIQFGWAKDMKGC